MPCKRPDGLDATLVSMQIGDRLATLWRLATRVAEEIDAADSPNHVERLAGRLALLLKEIDELQPASESSAVDEVLKRREDRRRQDQAVVVSHAESRGIGRGDG